MSAISEELVERLKNLAESLEGDEWEHPLTAVGDCMEAAMHVQTLALTIEARDSLAATNAKLRSELADLKFHFADCMVKYAGIERERDQARDLLITFGQADIALEDSEDGLGCDKLIDDHANAYKAIKAEARRLAKEVLNV